MTSRYNLASKNLSLLARSEKSQFSLYPSPGNVISSPHSPRILHILSCSKSLLRTACASPIDETFPILNSFPLLCIRINGLHRFVICCFECFVWRIDQKATIKRRIPSIHVSLQKFVISSHLKELEFWSSTKSVYLDRFGILCDSVLSKIATYFFQRRNYLNRNDQIFQ